jgi:hypothetical protein
MHGKAVAGVHITIPFKMKEDMQNTLRVIMEVLDKFDFNAVQEHMRKYGCHPGYNMRKGEVPSIEMIRDAAGYVLEQLLTSNEESVFIQDFVAMRSGDQILLMYPTLAASAGIRPEHEHA